jgi:hypothetical protein
LTYARQHKADSARFKARAFERRMRPQVRACAVVTRDGIR